MRLDEKDQVTYIANVYCLLLTAGIPSVAGKAAFAEICSAIGAKKSLCEAAIKRSSTKGFSPTKTSTFVSQISNLADMLYVAAIDGDLTQAEKNIIEYFISDIKLTVEQSSQIAREAVARAKQTVATIHCPICGAATRLTVNFCSACGSPIASPASPTQDEIPPSGYALEFCESTSASFPAALKIAESAPFFSSSVKNKKTWFLAVWPDENIATAGKLASTLSGLRNKRAYYNGKEVQWDELFGFSWCADHREAAYRPMEYCFGKDDNRLNSWGCKQADMSWGEWERWFSYGRFQKEGLLTERFVWFFDKERIRHELMSNLHRVKHCPYLRRSLIESVLQVFPDKVVVTENGPWQYSRSYEETPGCIKITEVEKTQGVEFKTEYFSDGVRPRGTNALKDLLTAAFTQTKIHDIELSMLFPRL